jgi:hypothetical protein
MTGWYDVRQRWPAERVPEQADPNAASLDSRPLGAPAIIMQISGHQAEGKTYAQGSLRVIRFSHNRPRSRRCDARYGVQHTGQPYPHAVGNLDGYDYYLNNDQWNEQSTSNLSRSAVRLRLMCDRVASLDA